MRTVFYSWQSDLPNSTNRGLIEECLEKAIDELHVDQGVRVLEADRDIQGETGSPDIAETIFEKIDRCSAFVADVSFINGVRSASSEQPVADGEVQPCDCTRLTPNPNVMCEWGRATHSIGFERMITVLNTATGKVEELPFDVRKRSVLTYSLKKGEEKRDAKKMLVGKLKHALGQILSLPLAILDLQFADPETEVAIGRELSLSNGFFSPLEDDQIPEIGRWMMKTPFGHSVPSFEQPNELYYHEKMYYLLYRELMRPITVALTNTGSKLLSNVHLEYKPKSTEDSLVFMIEESEFPQVPKKKRSLGFNAEKAMRSIRPIHFSPGTVDVTKVGNQVRGKVSFGDIQAKARIVSHKFFLGSNNSAVELEGLLFADELPQPIPVNLSVKFQTAAREFSLAELRTPDKTLFL